MHACQDALLTVFKGHILAAACIELGIEGPNDDINGVEINQTLLKDVTLKVAKRLSVISEAFLNESVSDTGDGVHNYARVLCHFAALVYLFIDAWKEGDGERVIRCWKMFMVHFHAEKKTKYALEALRLQFLLVTLQPYLVHQLMWGRFVNTHGGKGRNIPCDLHNEHINKLYKDIVANMGANFTEVASTRAARAVSSLERLALAFDKHTGIHPEATAHTTREDEKDVKMVVDVVLKARVLDEIQNRYHSKFPKFSQNPLHTWNRKKMIEWIQAKAKQHSNISDTHPNPDSEDENDEEIDLTHVDVDEVDY